MEEEQNKISRSSIIGNLSKIVPVGFGVYDLWKLAVPFVILILLLGYFIYKGMPWYIGGFFMAFLILFYVLEAVRVKRIASVDLASVPSAIQTQNLEYDPNEQVVAYAAAISGGPVGGVNVEVLGKGENKYPQNSLIMTTKNIIFVFVPLLGADKIVGGNVIGGLNFIYNRGEILKKLEEMISTMSLPDIFKSYPKNFYFNIKDIEKVKFGRIFKSMSFRAGGRKYYYSFRSKEDRKKLKEIFKQLGKI